MYSSEIIKGTYAMDTTNAIEKKMKFNSGLLVVKRNSTDDTHESCIDQQIFS